MTRLGNLPRRQAYYHLTPLRLHFQCTKQVQNFEPGTEPAFLRITTHDYLVPPKDYAVKYHVISAAVQTSLFVSICQTEMKLEPSGDGQRGLSIPT
jgi:hypothetical protein